MGICYITRRGKGKNSTGQVGIYPIGTDGIPTGDVIVPEGVTNLSGSLFNNNKNITGVQLPESCVSMGSSSFDGCSNLTSVQFSDNITAIPSNCFRSTALETIYLSSAITSIGSYAFNYAGISNITIADDAKFDLGSSCFSRTKVTNQDVENLLAHANTISGNVFDYTDTITDIAICRPYNSMFYQCTKLATVKITGTTGQSGSYGIGDSIFSGCTSLKNVIFELPENDSLKKIDSSAFYNCSALPSIAIPSTTENINSYAFYNCSALTEFTIPDSVVNIGSNAFSNCSNLSTVTIGNNASYELGSRAFYNCTSLTNESAHNIMEHYNAAYDYVFYGCTGLTDVQVSRFWHSMFYACTNLVKATSLQGKPTGNNVFEACTSLQEVYIADGTDTIGSSVFKNCTSLKTVYLPSSIVTANNNALTDSGSNNIFYGCTALEDVQLGQDWNMSLSITVSANLTVDSMTAMFNSLKDLTGDTAKTLTLGSTNLAKLTDEQKAVAINKNWTLA